MSTIAFELVSPERLLVSRPVTMVTVPGSEGDFGVLPGHAPMVSTLRVGVVGIKADGEAETRFFVAGGFAEVSPERCTVLAEEAMPVAELDRAKLEDDIKRAGEELLVADTDELKERLSKRVALAQAKLAVIAH